MGYHKRDEDDPFDFVVNSLTDHHQAGEKIACFVVAWAEHKGLECITAKTVANLARWTESNAKQMLTRPRNQKIIEPVERSDGKQAYRLLQKG